MALTDICLADRLSSDSVLPLSNNHDCPDKYYQPPGTYFCIVENTTLTMHDKQYLVDVIRGEECPKNFVHSVNYEICIEDHLSLTLVNKRLTLLSPKLDCPEGFEQKTRSTHCAPIESSTSQRLSHSFSGLDCLPGFIRPPGYPLCVSFEIAFKTHTDENFGIEVLNGQCPGSWARRHEGGFCLPKYSKIACGSEDFPCNKDLGDIFRIVEDNGGCCNAGNTRAVHYFLEIDHLTSIPGFECSPPEQGQHLNCVDPRLPIKAN